MTIYDVKFYVNGREFKTLCNTVKNADSFRVKYRVAEHSVTVEISDKCCFKTIDGIELNGVKTDYYICKDYLNMKEFIYKLKDTFDAFINTALHDEKIEGTVDELLWTVTQFPHAVSDFNKNEKMVYEDFFETAETEPETKETETETTEPETAEPEVATISENTEIFHMGKHAMITFYVGGFKVDCTEMIPENSLYNEILENDVYDVNVWESGHEWKCTIHLNMIKFRTLDGRPFKRDVNTDVIFCRDYYNLMGFISCFRHARSKFVDSLGLVKKGTILRPFENIVTECTDTVENHVGKFDVEFSGGDMGEKGGNYLLTECENIFGLYEKLLVQYPVDNTEFAEVTDWTDEIREKFDSQSYNALKACLVSECIWKDVELCEINFYENPEIDYKRIFNLIYALGVSCKGFIFVVDENTRFIFELYDDYISLTFKHKCITRIHGDIYKDEFDIYFIKSFVKALYGHLTTEEILKKIKGIS